MKYRIPLALCLLLVGVLTLPSFAKTDFDIVKQRVTEELMKPPVDDRLVESLLSQQRADGTWPGIDYTNVSREGFEHRIHLSNMVTMGRAYKNRESNYYKSKKVKNSLELALNLWVKNDYICDNWWHNQIGTPDQLVTLMLLAGDILPVDLVQKAQPIIGRANIDAPGARPGGDRIKIAGIQAKNMLFIGDSQTFDKVVRVIEGEIKYVEWIGANYGFGFRRDVGGFDNRTESGRGIQFDNSFHHRIDGVNNTLSYGTGYASAFIEWADYVAGTGYAFSPAQLNRLVDYYLDGICKHLVYGKWPDPGAKNRSISREGALRPYNSGDIMKLLKATDYRKTELEEIRDTRDSNSPSTLSHATFYWNTEHFTFQRPGFFTSVRLYSTRNFNMEEPYNSEGLLNHHRGDGANHISVTGTEYDDIAPVFDYQKVPGATILQKTQLPPPDQIQKLGLTDFAGAATDGHYGAVGFDFKSPHDPLVARKSWFFFDEQYVCLGAGISCKNSALPVATTMNQCLLRGDVKVSDNGLERTVNRGQHDLNNVSWIFHNNVGYIFPERIAVKLNNEEVAGSWWTINKQTDSPKDTVKKDVFTLWLDHGVRPSDAQYAYIVAPSVSLEKARAMAETNDVEILSNTPELQAVRHKDLQMVQAVFYKAGALALNENTKIAVNTPGILLLKFDDGKLVEATISDPNRELSVFNFSISGDLKTAGENTGVKILQENGSSQVTVFLPEGVYAGSSVNVFFE